MNLVAVRALGRTVAFNTHGLTATVTRPSTAAISTLGIWVHVPPEDRPYGTDLQRRDPRRVLAIPRADVPTMPRGTTVVIPDAAGGDAKTWTVDGLERADPDHWRVLLVL